MSHEDKDYLTLVLVSVWLELAEQYLQSVVLEFSLQSQTYGDYTQHTRHWVKNKCCGVK